MKTPRHQSEGMSGGRRKQSAIPQSRGFGDHRTRAGGLILRGVVLNSYVQLDGPLALPPGSSAVSGVYCDLLVYASIEGYRNGPLLSVPVVQNAGMHTGHIWVPRPSRQDVSGADFTPDFSDPADLDGDHVLVQFLEDDLTRPLITGRYLHPRMGQGNENLPAAGHRMQLKLSDKEPYFWKHSGSYFGIDGDGNFTLDTTRAHSGEYNASGEEEPAANAANGNATFVLSDKTALTVLGVDKDGNNPKFSLTLSDNQLVVQLSDGASLKVEDKDGNAITTLGDGAANAVNFQKLNEWWETMKAALTAFDLHVHASAMGPTGPPVPVIAATSIAANAKSTHLLIPDE